LSTGRSDLFANPGHQLFARVVLHEKGGTERETPCARDILTRIDDLWKSRAGREEDDFAFRYLDGTRLTRRRYNTIFLKVHNNLPWVKRLGVSSHWFRHTTLTDIAHATNGRIASAYAGHTSSRNTTDGYTMPAFEDLVSAHDLIFPSFTIGSPLQANSLDLVQRATSTSPPSQEAQFFREEPLGTLL
jgi:integrase